jgi:hypothetical protein
VKRLDDRKDFKLTEKSFKWWMRWYISLCVDYETVEKQKLKNKNLKKEYIEVEPKLEKIEEQPMVTSAN